MPADQLASVLDGLRNAYLATGAVVLLVMLYRSLKEELPHGFLTRVTDVEFFASVTVCMCLALGGGLLWPLVVGVELARWVSERRRLRRLPYRVTLKLYEPLT